MEEEVDRKHHGEDDGKDRKRDRIHDAEHAVESPVDIEVQDQAQNPGNPADPLHQGEKRQNDEEDRDVCLLYTSDAADEL